MGWSWRGFWGELRKFKSKFKDFLCGEKNGPEAVVKFANKVNLLVSHRNTKTCVWLLLPSR